MFDQKHYLYYIDNSFFRGVQSRCYKRIVQTVCTKRVYRAIVRSTLRLYKKVVTKTSYKTIVRQFRSDLLYRASVRMAPRGFSQWLDCTMSFLQVFHVIFVRSYCTIDCTMPLYRVDCTMQLYKIVVQNRLY